MAKKVVKVADKIDRNIMFFDIDQMRKEMSHSIQESIAISILALLLFIGAPSVFPEIINPYLPSSLKVMQAIVAVPSVFWLLTVLTNIVRYIKIFKLRRKLKD